MIPLVLWYSHEQAEGEVVRTHDELDAALDRAVALSSPEWPVLAEVTQLDDKFGTMLYLGLHVDHGAIMYPGDTHRFYTCSEGTPNGDPLLYMQGTSDNEFPPNAELPVTVIRQAAHEFADTGVRPACVEWQVWTRGDAGTGSELPQP
jgi:hypothetical protein